MELRGVLIRKEEKKVFDSGFTIQEFFVDCKRYNPNTGEAYENILKFQATGSTVLDALESIKKGDAVNISFSPQGLFYEKKDNTGKGHIQNLKVWKLEKVENKKGNTKEEGQPFIEYEDDLPF
ncbi:DUF3127 domain-containing protein [Elizabethkingia argentiflava]|uniref:DUF3127 domain-containing protein n=1 Tax=Elizabethkingia argenteiflava TaxID=2681556 RepID=A0A845PPZ9_9FLAO|nr:DUF3127 domain-containing protein [Elizabethkingia argenteiflava]NAW50389.1 DUF3127 domain-containing protein [Elizabethkingia argenteiflava]